MLDRGGNNFVGKDVWEEPLGVAGLESAHEMGLALKPIQMFKSRFNATLRDGQAVGLPVDAFPSG